MDPPPKRTMKRMFGYALVGLFVVCMFARNVIVRHAAIELGSRVLGTRVDVAGVSIGMSKVQIDGIRLYEPGSSDTQIDVKHVSIKLTPWQGIRQGVWAQQVFIEQPTLHLRFDRDGGLVSKFPAGGESESKSTKIPVARLDVRDAKLVVHQVGKEPFALSKADLAATFDEEIKLRATVADLLGGTIEFVAVVDGETYEGHSKLNVDGIRVDTERLAELPLVPPSVNREPVVATVSASLMADHPAGELDFRKHGLRALVGIRDVETQSLGTLCRAFQLRLVNQSGKLNVSGRGEVIDGIVEVTASCNSTTTPLAASSTLTISDLDGGQIASRFFPDQDLASKFQLHAGGDVTMDGRVVSFTSSSEAILSDIRADGIEVSDVVANVTSSGSVSLDDLLHVDGEVKGSVESDGVSLDAIAKRFHLPASQGHIDLSSDFQVSLADLTASNATPSDAIALAVSIKSSGVAVGEFWLQDSAAYLTMRNGVAIAQWKDAVVFDSTATRIASCDASVRVPLDAAQSLSSELRLSLSPTASLARFIGVDDEGWRGIGVAKVAASCVVGEVTTPDAWTSTASLACRDLAFANESIADTGATIAIRDGRVTVPPFQVQWQENVLRLSADGTVGEPVAISGQIAGERLDLSSVADLASRFSRTPLPLTGVASLGGEFRLTAMPFNFAASGSVALQDAFYANSKIGQASVGWKADRSGVQLRSSSDRFFGGSFDVVANAKDLDWTQTVVEGRFQNLQASRLAALVDGNLPVTGSLDGGLSVTSIASLETLAGRAWVSSRGVSVHRIPLEIRSANVSIQASEISAAIEGVVADGQFRSAASGRLSDIKAFAETSDRDLARVPIVAHGKVVDLPIESLTRQIQLPNELRTLGGKLNASFVRDPAMLDGRSLVTASGSVSELRLNRVRLSDRILGDVTVYGDRIELRRIDGRFADGRLSGKADVRLESTPTGTFDFSAMRINLRRAAAAAGSQPISGSGSVQIRGRIGQVLSGRADVSLSHGLFAGLSIPDASFPIDWSYSQPSKVARWQCCAGMISAGGGTVRVSSEGSVGNALDMTTHARIERVDSAKLMQGKSVGAGTISGTVNLQAKRARSPKQFSGDYQLTLANVSTMEIPVLDQLPSMVSLSPPRPGQGQDGGTVRGRLAGGLVHVDELAIAQSNVQVLMSGNATLDGRLNFDLTASTQSSGPADSLLDLADSPLMLAAPAPIALIAKANDLLKDRVVHVHVGGNAARPTLRLQPGKQLGQDAVQFFLKSSFGNVPASVANRSSQSTRR